jgi:hypothetical protein
MLLFLMAEPANFKLTQPEAGFGLWQTLDKDIEIVPLM